MAPSAKLSVLAEITKAPVRVAAPTTKLAVLPFYIIDTVTAVNKYAPIAYNGGWNSTLAETDSRLALQIEVVSWTIRIPAASALGPGQTLDFSFVIDGTPDATMTIPLVEGDSSGRKDGSLVIPADSLVSIQGIVGGGLASVLVYGGIVGYRS